MLHITHIKLGTTGIMRRAVLWQLENIALAMAIVIETTQREVCSASARAQHNGLLETRGEAQYFSANKCLHGHCVSFFIIGFTLLSASWYNRDHNWQQMSNWSFWSLPTFHDQHLRCLLIQDKHFRPVCTTLKGNFAPFSLLLKAILAPFALLLAPVT